jgi:hypothetical protein
MGCVNFRRWRSSDGMHPRNKVRKSDSDRRHPPHVASPKRLPAPRTCTARPHTRASAIDTDVSNAKRLVNLITNRTNEVAAQRGMIDGLYIHTHACPAFTRRVSVRRGWALGG